MSPFAAPTRRRGRSGGLAVSILGALLLPALLIAGCGSSGSSSTTSSTATVSAADLGRAADVSAAASGYRTVMTMSENLPGLGQLTMNGSGAFGKQQGSMTLTIKVPGAAAAALGGALKLSMVIDHGVLYMKLPTSLTDKLPGVKPWLELNLNKAGAGSSSSGISSLMSSSGQLSDPGQYFQWLHAVAGSSLQNLGSATINGVQTTHYHAEVGLSQLSQAFKNGNQQPAVAQAESQLSKEIAGGKIPIDVYIDSSNLVRRIVINEKATVGGKSVSTAITVDFPEYGTQPAPTVPPANEVTNFKSLSGIP
jgi:hypothetical protein